jgi:hypothetical protein
MCRSSLVCFVSDNASALNLRVTPVSILTNTKRCLRVLRLPITVPCLPLHAAWLTNFPEPFNYLVASLMAIFPGDIAKGNAVGNLNPLRDDLTPYLCRWFPETWKFIKDGAVQTGGAGWVASIEKAPLKPLSAIIAAVESRPDVRRDDGPLPKVNICGDEQTKV